jgi:hypothetical protein
MFVTRQIATMAVCARMAASALIASVALLGACDEGSAAELVTRFEANESGLPLPEEVSELASPKPPPQPLLNDIALGNGGFALDGQGANDLAGAAMNGVGDVNGDGYDDFLVGVSGPGLTYLIFGQSSFPTGPFDLGYFNQGIDGIAMLPQQSADRCGFAVDGGGDFNGDGLPDFIVGAYLNDDAGANTGRAYVVYGHSELGVVSTFYFDHIENGAGAGNAYGFLIDGEIAGDQVGESVANAGDVNGDGFDDFVLGARQADPNGAASGRSYVIFGSEDAQVGGVLSLADIADGLGGFAIDGAAAGDASG